MKIQIKKIVRPMLLTEYQPEYVDEQGQPIRLMVWVNPPREMTEARIARSQAGQALQEELGTLKPGEETTVARVNEILEEIAKIGQESMDWLAVILSQGPEETKMSFYDVAALAADGRENDPRLYGWILSRAWEMITEYRQQKKKA